MGLTLVGFVVIRAATRPAREALDPAGVEPFSEGYYTNWL